MPRHAAEGLRWLRQASLPVRGWAALGWNLGPRPGVMSRLRAGWTGGAVGGHVEQQLQRRPGLGWAEGDSSPVAGGGSLLAAVLDLMREASGWGG